MIERVKNYSEIVKEVNHEKRQRPNEPTEQGRATEPSKREKMLEFAKKIPRPAVKQPPLPCRPDQPASQAPAQEAIPRQIEFLESQHQLYQQKLKDLKIY